jgi:hypothetical protein
VYNLSATYKSEFILCIKNKLILIDVISINALFAVGVKSLPIFILKASNLILINMLYNHMIDTSYVCSLYMLYCNVLFVYYVLLICRGEHISSLSTVCNPKALDEINMLIYKKT